MFGVTYSLQDVCAVGNTVGSFYLTVFHRELLAHTCAHGRLDGRKTQRFHNVKRRLFKRLNVPRISIRHPVHTHTPVAFACSLSAPTPSRAILLHQLCQSVSSPLLRDLPDRAGLRATPLLVEAPCCERRRRDDRLTHTRLLLFVNCAISSR